jgi:hypothetical protein
MVIIMKINLKPILDVKEMVKSQNLDLLMIKEVELLEMLPNNYVVLV